MCVCKSLCPRVNLCFRLWVSIVCVKAHINGHQDHKKTCTVRTGRSKRILITSTPSQTSPPSANSRYAITHTHMQIHSSTRSYTRKHCAHTHRHSDSGSYTRTFTSNRRVGGGRWEVAGWEVAGGRWQVGDQTEALRDIPPTRYTRVPFATVLRRQTHARAKQRES